MPHPTPVIHLLLALPLRDFAIYAEATNTLSRVMGKKAPDALTLIVHTLRCRDARGLIDDYLESIDWPVTLRKPSDSKARPPRQADSNRTVGKRPVLPAPPREDLSRN